MRQVNERIQTKLDALPTTPGVYQWKDRFGKVIYVGKAVNYAAACVPTCGKKARTVPK